MLDQKSTTSPDNNQRTTNLTNETKNPQQIPVLHSLSGKKTSEKKYWL